MRNLKIKGTKSKWIGKGRYTNEFRDQDDILRLPRLGTNTNAKTHETMILHNIRTISDLKYFQIDQLPPVRGIQSIWKNAQENSLPRSSPVEIVDRRTKENPYQSENGEK